MSETTINCSHCKRSFEVEDKFVGRTAECPVCGKDFVISRSEPGVPAAASPAVVSYVCYLEEGGG